MRPLTDLTAEAARSLEGLLFDLDDTLLDRGVLTEAAYASLWRLANAGLRLVAVTGRPFGWAEVMARQWPVDAVIAENGAIAVFREGDALRRYDECDEPTRRASRQRLESAFETLRQRFAEARLSEDSTARVTDLAIDIGEAHHVPDVVVRAMAEEARRLGLRTFVSTVHLHLTCDAHDKASGAIALLRHRFGCDATSARARYGYVGDSTNDAPAFGAFALTFGVANVRAFLGKISVPPRFVSSKERGSGFAEIAARLVGLRRGVLDPKDVLDRGHG